MHIKDKYFTTETLLMIELMCSANVPPVLMEKFLSRVKTPGFDLTKLAPSVYHLQKIENQLFTTEVWETQKFVWLIICRINGNNSYKKHHTLFTLRIGCKYVKNS